MPVTCDKAPEFKSYDEYCIHIQELLSAELLELAFEFAGNRKGLRLLERRTDQIAAQIRALKAKVTSAK